MDDRTADQRSETMAAIKSEGTGLEKKFISALKSSGVSGLEHNPEDVFGKPDLVYRERKLAIFIDSCFWHGCPQHCRMPNSNRDYWDKKIERNQKRDREVKRKLIREGWVVKRIWEHSITNSTKLKWWVTRIQNLVAS